MDPDYCVSALNCITLKMGAYYISKVSLKGEKGTYMSLVREIWLY